MKLCECGCGQPTRLATQTRPEHGHVKGQPVRYRRGHNHRGGSASSRFEASVDRAPGLGPEGDCHEWTGQLFRGGYGSFHVEGKNRSAHRVAWWLEHGEWPTLCVLHRCDNRRCVNIAHLWLGTYADDNADMAAKGRAGFFSILTPAQAGEIRALKGAEGRAVVAARYGVAPTTVSGIWSGARWRNA